MKCGNMCDIIVLYILPLVIYLPVGCLVHLYWYQESSFGFEEHDGYQTLSFSFFGLYLGAPLVYLIISMIFNHVRLNFPLWYSYCTKLFFSSLGQVQGKRSWKLESKWTICGLILALALLMMLKIAVIHLNCDLWKNKNWPIRIMEIEFFQLVFCISNRKSGSSQFHFVNTDKYQ